MDKQPRKLCAADFALSAGDRLALVDGYSYVFRAFHALPALSRSSDGAPTGAVSGYCNMLFKIITADDSDSKKQPTTHIAVVFDTAADTFRKQIYPQYKANRPPPPPELIPQFAFVREATEAFGIPAFAVDTFEADDIIATLATLAAAQNVKVDIYSADKDLMQLVDDNVRLVDAMKNKAIRRAQVEEKFGVPPKLLGDLLALTGDSSDNIPGVSGIGVKTAAALLSEYGDLETLLARAGEIRQNKRRQTLLEQADLARLSRRLVTLHQSVPLQPIDLTRKQLVGKVILPYLAQMEMKTLGRRVAAFLGEEPAAPSNYGTSAQSPLAAATEASQPSLLLPRATKPLQVTVIEEHAQLQALLDEVQASGELALSCRLDNSDPMRANLLGIGMAAQASSAYYLPAQPSAPHFGEESDKISRSLQTLLNDTAITAVGHNVKCDMVVLPRYGITLPAAEDTMLAAACALHDTSQASTHDLGQLAEHELGYKATYNLAAVEEKSAPPEEQQRGAAERAHVIAQLWQHMRLRLIAERAATQYYTLEKPLSPILAQMQSSGITVDAEHLTQLSGEFAAGMEGLQQEVWELAGCQFNLASPSQIAEVLFGTLGLPGGKKTSGGKWSTDAKVLDALAASGHGIAQAIHQWRTLAKLKNTYTDVLPSFVNPATNRVHTSYSLAAVSTGRLSSIHPNLQNIPARTADGRKIRAAFVAKPGHKLISADYSQIELRVLAHIAKEEALSAAFAAGTDIHAATARALLGNPEAQPDLRRRAKAINFGIIYGISAHGLAQQIGVSRGEAANFIASYFKRFPGIQTYMQQTPRLAATLGYVSTLFGRRINVPGINDGNHVRRAFWQRFAINAPIQGSAADLMRRAMIRVAARLSQAGLNAKMLLQVHDELVIEAADDDVEAAVSIVREAMSSAGEPAVRFDSPVLVDTGVASSWERAH